MNIVLDTNVLVAAFIAHGVCNELLEHCAIHHSIVLSNFILEELRGTLIEKFAFAPSEAGEAVRLLKARSIIVNPIALSDPVSRDSDDDEVIGTAVAGSCDCIVTGDKDLLCLKQFQGIEIVSPSAFWQFESKKIEQASTRRPGKSHA